LDAYAPGVTDKIIVRVGLCLKGNIAASKYQKAVKALFEKRGEAVHLGSFDGTPDLLLARRAYAFCLAKIAARMPLTAKKMNEPIRQLVGA